MNFIKFLFSLLIAAALVVGLNEKWGQVPPLGKFLDPYNGFWANGTSGEVPFQESNNIPELNNKVEVYYDSLLIPHIYAESDEDLYKAQGFVTAQNRLWQMEFQTHASAGRISEIIGGGALEFDRYQRRNGLLYAAEKAIKAMEDNDVTSNIINSYTEGVNAYINGLTYKELPIEYKLLDYKPENWSNLKSALLLKYMANDLAGGDSDAENNYLLKTLGKDRFDFLFPDRYENMDPIIPKSKKWEFEPLEVNRPDSVSFPLVFSDKKMPQPDPQNGSNNWAVSGSKTNTGKPMLANDPHLGLNLPSIWYVMHLNSPEVNVLGATLPGALGVIIGFNDSIAWGVTNATRDVRDWYHIQFKDKDKKEYLHNNKWLKTQKVVQTFKIRGEEAFNDTIYYTHHGPIVYDETFGSENSKVNLALRWTAHDPSNEQLTFHQLNRAANYDDYKNALTHFDCPAQNFVFASTQGDIAIWVNGKFPLRWEEQGKFIMDGTRADMDWAGFIPREHNAFVKNPPRGFVSSANQIPVDSTYPYYHYDRGYEHYRNRRINNRLAELENITIEDMKRLQNDNYHMLASEILPAMLDSLDRSKLSEPQKEAYDKLKNWNYIASEDAVAPTYFEIWWNKLYRNLWDEFYVEGKPSRRPELPVTVQILKNHPDEAYIDNQSTTEKETVSSLYEQSFKFAVDSVSNWTKQSDLNLTWSNFKNTTIQHLARLSPFSHDHVQIGGNRHIVNATSGRHGASWRMIVSLEKPVKAFGVYPGGQSGNPGSYFYDNLIDAWASESYYQLDNSNEPDLLGQVIFKQTLTPTAE
ncbi:penicillin acylase family protein [Marivirga atlantica]|jgi:penicillin amidase|uniref:Penicillin acylase family protein n=1 Tax=Marivirga atlantica TaxID=1548457 RepID=A0A937DKU6_9BACT|nr:penicillin acylase family protein [Marivirga atlantica]MBL0766414.1 penicillin acylase family protein [Marivirga atlantica]